MNDHLKNENLKKDEKPTQPEAKKAAKPVAKKAPKRMKKQPPKPPVETPDDGRDLRHVMPREGNVDELRKARMLARQRRRRKLMIQRTIVVLSIVLLVALIATAVMVKVVADQKSARGETVRFLAVKKIVVEGDTRYTDEEIIKASKLYVGQSLLSVNKAKACQNIVANLPYLDGNRVVVDNASFYNLRIRVAEMPVLAAVKTDKDWMILGQNNLAMERVTEDKIPKGTVRIQGATFVNQKVGKTLLDERSLRICQTLISAADTYDLDSMTTIDITVKTKIAIMLNERIEVVMGNETNLTNQIKALTEMLPTLYKNNGEDAAGRLNMIFYSDDDKSNDKSIYTPQEVLDKLEQAQKIPMAAVQTGDMWTIINEDNLVLESVPVDQVPANVVKVVGATYEVVVVGKELLDVRGLYLCHTIIQEANRQEAVNVDTIDLTDPKAITVTLKEGLQVMLGEGTAPENQIKALAENLPTVWEQYGEDADGVLDVTTYGDDDPDNDKATYTMPLAE